MTGQAWVWVVLAIVAVALVVLVIFRSRNRGSAVDVGGAPSEAAPARAVPSEEVPSGEAMTAEARIEPAVEPAAAVTAPVGRVLVEPAPVEPSPVEPSPVEPAAVERAAVEPVPAVTASAAESNGAVPAEVSVAPESPQERESDSALAALDSGSVAGGSATTVATRALTHPGSALPNADGSAPSGGYTIKAIAGSKRYHDASSPVYAVIRADVFFRDPEDASAAGFVYWKARRRTAPAPAEAPVAETPAPTAAAPDAPPRGSAPPNPDRSAPDGYPIKANAGSKRYHDPDSPYYSATRADLWFRDADDAAAAGFVHWTTPR